MERREWVSRLRGTLAEIERRWHWGEMTEGKGRGGDGRPNYALYFNNV